MSDIQVVFVHGSPSNTSRSSRVVKRIEERLAARGVRVLSYGIQDFDAAKLLAAQTSEPRIAEFVEAVKSSDALVVGTPIYKATFSGALKVILDLLPQDALVGRAALGVATGRLKAHLEKVTRGLEGLFEFFQIASVIETVALNDELVYADAEASRLSDEVEALLEERSQALLAAIERSRTRAK